MRKYKLDSVYKALALEDIYKLLSDEYDLVVDDIKSINVCMDDLMNPDLKLSETVLGSNLNLTPTLDTLSEQLEYLCAKKRMLEKLKTCVWDAPIKMEIPF